MVFSHLRSSSSWGVEEAVCEVLEVCEGLVRAVEQSVYGDGDDDFVEPPYGGVSPLFCLTHRGESPAFAG